jgi:biliverdin reductase
LVARPELDLIAICTINCEHAAIARAALEAGKHVIVEYPLALNAREGKELVALAQQQGKLLHVEHIELLGGLHQAVRQHLPHIGSPFYARYATLLGQRPAPRRWTYHQEMFGFPLIAALSRIHRFTDLFGKVESVSCQSRLWDAPESGYFTTCLCAAQLRFSNGLIAEIIYGKGEIIWQEHRTLELQGEEGALTFEGEVGNLVRGTETLPIEVGSRRGLFVKDTELVLDYLWENKPLYVTAEASLYALKVADAAWQSAKMGNTIYDIC